MIHQIFTIYDEKAKAYLPPFFLPTEGMAIRTFADCINSDTHQFGQHPEDYGIYSLGTFDDEHGTLNQNPPRIIRTGITLVEGQKPNPVSDGIQVEEYTDEAAYERARQNQIQAINAKQAEG